MALPLIDNLTDREDNGLAEADECVDPLADPDPGRTHTFAYDDADWVSEQIDQGLPGDSTDNRKITTTFTEAGQEASRLIERFNGSIWQTKQLTEWEYFQNGKLRTLTTRNQANDIVEDHEVAYIEDDIYLNGHRVTDEFVLERPGAGDCEDPNPCTATFEYDSRDRLESFANGHGESTTYALDTAGNILVKEKTGDPDRTYTYQGDQLETETEDGSGEDFEYFYDAQGNLECVTKLAGSRSDCNAPAGGSISPELVSLSSYDPLNRLTSFRTFGVLEPAHIGFEDDRTTYVHDALDRPYEQKERHGPSGPIRTKTFTYLGLSNLLSQEVHTNPGNTKTYGYDAFGHRISMTDDEEDKTFGYGYDVHGSASVLLDDDQEAPHATYGYDPYGEIDTTLTKGDVHADPTKPDQPPEDPLNPYRYTGKRLDSGSGSYDMGARRFNAGPARFLQQDLYLGALANLSLTVDPLTQNRYALAGGAPTSYIEVDGHGPAEDGAGNTGHYPADRRPPVTAPNFAPNPNPPAPTRSPSGGGSGVIGAPTPGAGDNIGRDNKYRHWLGSEAQALMSYVSSREPSAYIREERCRRDQAECPASFVEGILAASTVTPAGFGRLVAAKLGRVVGERVASLLARGAAKEGIEQGARRAPYTAGQRSAFERQLEQHGPESLLRSRTTLGRRLSEHEQKLEQIRAAGGYTSSVEREIGNFRGQIRAIDDLLGGL